MSLSIKHIAVLLLGLSVRLAASGQSVSARLDRPDYQVGDEIKLTLTVDMVQPADVVWPNLLEPLPGMEPISDRTDSTEGQLTRRISYLQFDTGAYQLPPLPIALVRGSDTSRLSTSGQNFTVGLVPVDTTAALRPIADRQDVDYKPIPWLMYGFFAAVLLALLAFLFYRYYWSKRPKKIQVETARPVPAKPSDEHAMDRLKELEARKLWQKEEVKAYYVELTDILREYVEGRFQEPALESTTVEILERLRHREIPGINRESLANTLRLADMVKFAKARPLPDQHQRALTEAYAFVEATRNTAGGNNEAGAASNSPEPLLRQTPPVAEAPNPAEGHSANSNPPKYEEP